MKESVSRVRLFDGPLELSWHHCATTSDFIADIFALRFQSSRNDYLEVRHCIGYLVNELIENAMKFRATRRDHDRGVDGYGELQDEGLQRVDGNTAPNSKPCWQRSRWAIPAII